MIPREPRVRAWPCRSDVFAAAVVLDAILGDPERWPHPVRILGWSAGQFEARLRPFCRGENSELAAGAILAGSITGGASLVTGIAIAALKRLRPKFGLATEIYLAETCIALRNLLQEASCTTTALESGDVVLARKQLSRIVGRDTQDLSPSEISRAIIETLAESLCDGVVAPLFYLARGGVPLAMAYKAINTLDSMIGRRDERYLFFGRAAARLDDCANLLPSRITALLITLAALVTHDASGRKAWKTWLADGSKHASPNAGQAEAAMAGALIVRLGGVNTYSGERVVSPDMGGSHRAPTWRDARRAIRLTALAGYLAAAALWVWLRSSERRGEKR